MSEYVRAYQEVDAVMAKVSTPEDRLYQFLLRMKPEAREYMALVQLKTLDDAYEVAIKYAVAREPRSSTSTSSTRRTEVHDTELERVTEVAEERHTELLDALRQLAIHSTEARPMYPPRRPRPPNHPRKPFGVMTAEKRADLENRTCFKCHKPGHYADVCKSAGRR
jgi:hypothetical protein